jgi:excinuclease ABC subunit A
MGGRLYDAAGLPVMRRCAAKKESLWFKIDDKNIAELSALILTGFQDWMNGLESRMNKKQNVIAKIF